MDWSNLTIPILSLLGAVFAGAGLKVVEKWLQRSKDRDDTATNLRTELRAELTALKQEMALVEKDLDDWKSKYYDVIEKYILAQAQLQAAIKILKDKGIDPPEPPLLNGNRPK